MKQLVAIFYNQPDKLFSLGELAELVGSVNGKKPRRGTVRKYVAERLVRARIVERIERDNNVSYRCKDRSRAFSYLEGRFLDYAPPLAPEASPPRPVEAIRHRPNYHLRLSNAEMDRAMELGSFIQSGSAPPYWHVKTSNFTLKAWPPNGKAHIFLTGAWRQELRDLFDSELVAQVEELVQTRQGHEGIARPPPLPVGKPFRIVEPDGSTTIIQYGKSQIASGELDRHGIEDGPNGNLVEAWLYDETKFKVDVANRFYTLERKLEALPTAIGESVGKAVQEAIKKAMGLPDTKENEFRASRPVKTDFWYG